MTGHPDSKSTSRSSDDTLKQQAVNVVSEALSVYVEFPSPSEWRPLVDRTITVRTPTYHERTKLYDIEIRTVPALFRRYGTTESSSSKLVLTSPLGVTRTFYDPHELAQFLLPELEEGFSTTMNIHHVRTTVSGFVCVATPSVVDRLLTHLLYWPCPHCPLWLHSSQGYWWHLQQQHTISHCTASYQADWHSRRDETAMVVYHSTHTSRVECAATKQPQTTTIKQSLSKATVPQSRTLKTHGDKDNPWIYVKQGSLDKLRSALEEHPTMTTERDHHGALLLHWAAGTGWLDIVKYLIADCGCNVNAPQKCDKQRAFDGRTALHWACRNGHKSVVEYLLDKCGAYLDATTADGTTAFQWASWQGHLSILRLLYHKRADVHAVNSFGCNCVLWAAQGSAEIGVVEFLAEIGCNVRHMNHSGHGFLHKAAQRGNWELASWFVERYATIVDVSPDQDGCVPSDLAGMENHNELAEYLSAREIEIACQVVIGDRPCWLTPFSVGSNNVWESGGGVLRMRSAIAREGP